MQKEASALEEEIENSRVDLRIAALSIKVAEGVRDNAERARNDAEKLLEIAQQTLEAAQKALNYRFLQCESVLKNHEAAQSPPASQQPTSTFCPYIYRFSSIFLFQYPHFVAHVLIHRFVLNVSCSLQIRCSASVSC